MRVDLVFETVFSGFTRSMPLDRLGMWQFSTRRHLIALHGRSVTSRFSLDLAARTGAETRGDRRRCPDAAAGELCGGIPRRPRCAVSRRRTAAWAELVTITSDRPMGHLRSDRVPNLNDAGTRRHRPPEKPAASLSGACAWRSRVRAQPGRARSPASRRRGRRARTPGAAAPAPRPARCRW